MSKQLRPASSAISSQDLVAEVSAVSFSGAAQISGITHDSRCVLPGDLYVAVPGFKMHGIDFAKEAVAAGAVAILSDSTGIARAKTFNLEVPLI
jgi:UDP-N-acetylmuramoyl-L-alanyl-D-glutamate--2,6-diaminopimelate ligase